MCTSPMAVAGLENLSTKDTSAPEFRNAHQNYCSYREKKALENINSYLYSYNSGNQTTDVSGDSTSSELAKTILIFADA